MRRVIVSALALAMLPAAVFAQDPPAQQPPAQQPPAQQAPATPEQPKLTFTGAAGLLLVPWRWHHHFARRAVPQALRFLPLVGTTSILLGGLVLWSVLGGNAV